MKKNNLITGIIALCVGIVCFIIAYFYDGPLNSLLFGFAGAETIPGIIIIYKYFYWNRPKNKARYEERLEHERIELHDELKMHLRNKSGRCAYLCGLLVISISMVVFSILGALEIVANSRLIVLYLGGYLAFEIVIGIIIFNCLLKKY